MTGKLRGFSSRFSSEEFTTLCFQTVFAAKRVAHSRCSLTATNTQPSFLAKEASFITRFYAPGEVVMIDSSVFFSLVFSGRTSAVFCQLEDKIYHV